MNEGNKLRQAGLIAIAVLLTPILIMLSMDFYKDMQKHNRTERIKKAEAEQKANLKVEEMVRKAQKKQ